MERLLKAHDINKDGKFGRDSYQKQVFGKPHDVSLTVEWEYQIKSWDLVAIDNPDESFSVNCGEGQLFLCSM